MNEHMRLDGEWPALSWPLPLREALSSLNVEALQIIAGLHHISDWRRESSKEALVDGLAPILAEYAASSTELWDEERWGLLRKLVKNGGLLADPPQAGPVVYYFRERGMAFPGLVNGKRALVMPAELVEACARLEGLSGTPAHIKRNTENIRLTQGLLYYYGVLPEEELESRLLALMGEPAEDERDVFEVLVDARGFRGMYDVDSDGLYSNLDVEDPEAMLRMHEMRADLPYREFSKAELLKAGEFEFVDRTKALRELASYLSKAYGTDKREADVIAEICADCFKNGKSLSAAFEILQAEFSIDDARTVDAIGGMLARLNNTCRQWVLKGHTPEELSASVGGGAGGGIPSNVLAMPNRSQQADVISIRTGRKIGRNDPCPCGSGKKFKKCCGAVAGD